MLYAIITNSLVTNIILAEATFVALYYPTNAIRVDTITPAPQIGWTYAGGHFTPPASPTPPTPAPVTDLTPFAFMSTLFTAAEQKAIYGYVFNVALTVDQKQQIASILGGFQVAQDISLADPATISGVTYLGTAQPNGPGLIAAARVAQVLAGQSPAS